MNCRYMLLSTLGIVIFMTANNLLSQVSGPGKVSDFPREAKRAVALPLLPDKTTPPLISITERVIHLPAGESIPDYSPLLLGIWEDGTIMWSDNLQSGKSGPTYHKGYISPEMVNRTLEEFMLKGYFDSQHARASDRGPGMNYLSIYIKYQDRTIVISSVGEVKKMLINRMSASKTTLKESTQKSSPVLGDYLGGLIGPILALVPEPKETLTTFEFGSKTEVYLHDLKDETRMIENRAQQGELN